MKWKLLLSALVAVFAVFSIKRNRNNVCKTFSDYYSDRDSNPNCYYNPDHELEAQDIIKRQGFPVEKYQVTTEDNYILTLFRIPHGKNAENGNRNGKPVFLQHGITINCGAFLNIGNKSLAFVLANAGFDVWLGNFRGALYSRNHTILSPTSAEFWNFSFHELGVYDLKAQLNFVHQITRKQVTYIGFSMGSTASYVYASVLPEDAQKHVDKIISLAPIAYMKNIGMLSYFSYLWPLVRDSLQFITHGRFFPRPPLPKAWFKLLCFPYPFQMQICQFPDMIFFGFNYDQNDPETLPVTLQHNSDATSIKILTHYIQLIISGNFQYFDYGKNDNQQIYDGASEPPHYDLSKIRIPVYLIRAPNDLLSTKENVEKLHSVLPESSKRHSIHVIGNERFNHVDIFTGKDASSIVYNLVVKVINL